MGEEDARPVTPALEGDLQQKTKTRLCPGSLLPVHEAGHRGWLPTLENSVTGGFGITQP